MRTLVGAFLSLALVYLVGINVFLSTSLFEKVIDAEPDIIDIHYARGWSIWPGRIHAKELSIRGRDSNVEWILRLDDVDFDLALFALAKQRFTVTRVHGTGISFRIRQRLDAEPKSADEVADLPPIEGLAPYSVRPPKVASPELWSDAAWHLWTPSLERVTADDVREVWIDHERFEGSARITGRFYLKPLRAVNVGPCHVEVARGHVRKGAKVVAERLEQTTADVTVATFDPRVLEGSDLPHFISIALDSAPRVPDVANLALDGAVKLEGAIDVRRVALRIERGIVKNGSAVDLQAPGLTVIDGAHRVTGALALTADTASREGHDTLAFKADVDHAAITRSEGSGTEPPFLRAARLVAVGDTRALDLAEPFGDLHVLLTMAGGDLPDARALTAYVPNGTPLGIEGGHAQAEATFEVWRDENRAAGQANLAADDLDVALAKMRIRGAIAADASFARLDLATMHVEGARLGVSLSKGSLASARAPGTPLVRVTGLKLEAGGALDLADPLRTLDVTIAAPDAEVVEHGLLAAYVPKGSAMRLRSGRARFALDGKLAIADHLARGSVDVRARRVGFGYRDLALDANVAAHARVHDWKWERGDLALDEAVVKVDDVTVIRSGETPGDPALVAAHLQVTARSRHFALADPLGSVALTATARGVRLRDAEAINAFLPDGATVRIRARDGLLDAELHAEIEKHVARGEVAIRARGIGVGNERVHVEGALDAQARVADWDFARGSIDVRDARVTLSDVTGGFRTKDERAFSAERITFSGSAAGLDLARPTWHGLEGRLTIANANLPDARTLQTLVPDGTPIGIESGTARVSADVALSSTNKTGAGRVEIALGRAGVRFHTTHFVGDFRIVGEVRTFDPSQHRVDLSGSRVEMRDVAVTGATTETARWQGDVTFHQATLRLAPDPELDGYLRLDARDASPLLALLLRDELPKVLLGLTKMPALGASARLTVGPHRLALRDVYAQGGNLGLRGLYVARDEQHVGAFVVEKGPFSIGIHLGDDGTKVRFFGLDGWMRKYEHAGLELFEREGAAITREGAAP